MELVYLRGRRVMTERVEREGHEIKRERTERES